MIGMYHHLCASEMLDMVLHTYMSTSPGSPERLALSLEHVDHDDLVDVDACVRVDLVTCAQVCDNA